MSQIPYVVEFLEQHGYGAIVVDFAPASPSFEPNPLLHASTPAERMLQHHIWREPGGLIVYESDRSRQSALEFIAAYFAKACINVACATHSGAVELHRVLKPFLGGQLDIVPEFGRYRRWNRVEIGGIGWLDYDSSDIAVVADVAATPTCRELRRWRTPERKLFGFVRSENPFPVHPAPGLEHIFGPVLARFG